MVFYANVDNNIISLESGEFAYLLPRGYTEITALEARRILSIVYGKIDTNEFTIGVNPGEGWAEMAEARPSEHYTATVDGSWLFVADSCSMGRCREVDLLFLSKLAEHFTYLGNQYQVDHVSLGIMNHRVSKASAAKANPGSIFWGFDPAAPTVRVNFADEFRDVNNVWQVFATPDEFLLFADAVDTYCNNLKRVCTDHKDAMMAMTVEADILNYDITIGW